MEMVVLSLKRINCFAVVFDISFDNKIAAGPNMQVINVRPLKNVQFCSSSRKAKILTTGIHLVFWGFKFEPDPSEIGFAFHRASTEIGQKGAFCKGLKVMIMLKSETNSICKKITFSSNGFLLSGALHLPTTDLPPVVIGSHGLLSNSSSPKQIQLARKCNEYGIAFFRFDHRGCGQSDLRDGHTI